ncbi:MAG: DNA polymerase III subunit gamma/tau, partial [Oscillibacter sp.]|nr:DNA polymerase III subunit gamma/tau [Oscillibacter sp.]
GYDPATLKRLGKDVSAARLTHIASTLQKAAAELYFSTNRRTDAELCLLRLCDETLSGDLTALTSRVERLEEGGAAVAAAPAKKAEPPAPKREEKREASKEVKKEAVPIEEKTAEPAPPVKEEKNAAAEEKTEAPASAQAGAFSPQALIEACKGQLPPMYRAFLSMCGVSAEDDALTLIAPDESVKDRLDSDRVREVFAEEAKRVLGRSMRVLLRTGEVPKTSQQDNWNALMDFGGKFDNIEIK